jgi:CHAT domain-containing protein/tetratricopeptide (TPR) repeat protein
MGDYAAALPLLGQAVEIQRATVGQGHPLYAQSLYNLASLYEKMGNYAVALPLLQQAIGVIRDTLGERDPLYANSLSTLGSLYVDISDYAAALPLFRQALEIRRTALDEGHPDFAMSLSNLAIPHRALGDHAAALPLLQQALDIFRAALGEAHPEYALCLRSQAVLHLAMNDGSAALPLFRQVLEIRRATLGESHPEYASSLSDLAMIQREMGDDAAALPLLRQALQINRTALGEGHPVVGRHLQYLAVCSAGMGRVQEAMVLLEEAMEIDDRMIGQILSIGSERQRIRFLDEVLGRAYLYLSIVRESFADTPAAVRSALELMLRRRAIAAEATATLRDAMLAGKYPALRPQLRELAALRMQIARAALAGPSAEGTEVHRQRLAEWNARKEGVEAGLAQQIPEMNLEAKLRAADRRAVALGLPEGVALVEFVRLPILILRSSAMPGEPEWKPARYVAFVLQPGDPDDVRMIDLGESEPIDRLIADFRAGIIAEADGGAGRDLTRRQASVSLPAPGAGAALSAALFDRLAPALGGRTRLLIAPDGDLARLPFEVLPIADGRRLIDVYQISYLSCGRDVLRLGAAATGRPGAALIVADPDFDLEVQQRPALDLESSARHRGRRSRDLDRDGDAYHFDRLPATRAEGEQVGTLVGAEPWLDHAALEGRLKTQCQSPRILHLATHAFFLPDQKRGLDQASLSFTPPDDPIGGAARFSGPMMENPMLRSGLALAGANTWLKAGKPPEEAEDGLLTAEDVTGLDLLATELVVLSACETGLGHVHMGEGVFGLRRAFVLAGAKTLVMSLWKVPDEETQELMVDFYRRLLAGEGRAEALRAARHAMKAKYPDPFYWGAFICQGDPSPLPAVDRGHGR